MAAGLLAAAVLGVTAGPLAELITHAARTLTGAP
jgi:hydrogenase-4 component F